VSGAPTVSEERTLIKERENHLIKRIVMTVALAALLGSAFLAATPGVQAQSTKNPAAADPLTAAKFSLVIDGVEIAAFNEIVSLGSETEPGATAGATAGSTAQTPTKPLLPHVTLKRGMSTRMELWAWRQAVAEGQMTAARKSASLVMYDTAGTAVAKFWLTNAWPSSIELTALKAGSGEVLYETVTLLCDNLQRVSPS